MFVIIGVACLIASAYRVSVDGQAPTRAASASSKAWSPPRTPDGRPDIQGMSTNFDNTPTRPWKVAMPINRDPTYRMFEYACHEGNYGLPNTLKGARAEERESEQRR